MNTGWGREKTPIPLKGAGIKMLIIHKIFRLHKYKFVRYNKGQAIYVCPICGLTKNRPAAVETMGLSGNSKQRNQLYKKIKKMYEPVGIKIQRISTGRLYIIDDRNI